MDFSRYTAFPILACGNEIVGSLGTNRHVTHSRLKNSLCTTSRLYITNGFNNKHSLISFRRHMIYLGSTSW